MGDPVQILQSGRWLTLASPLGDDVLIATGLTGEEALSRLFSFEVEMVSTRTSIAAGDLLGKSITVKVACADGSTRAFNGIVSRFSAGAGLRNGYRVYRAELVPSVWLLTQRQDCRIFQNKTAKEIIEAVFADAGFTAFESSLSGTHPAREYCVQYNESDFAFVSRLMEEEGIYYFFKHAVGSHTMVLADAASSYLDSVDATASLTTGEVGAAGEVLTSWEWGCAVRAGEWKLSDYNFETPATDLVSTAMTVVEVAVNKQGKRFEWPGDYPVKATGDARAKDRIEQAESEHVLCRGEGRYRNFSPAYRFTLSGEAATGEKDKKFVLTTVRHEAADNAHFTGGPVNAQPSFYRNKFSCIPDGTPWRPARTTPKARVYGPQTATVTGASGDEIFTDKYGRIKVHFHWDLAGKSDETASCFVRVAQRWAGKSWGELFTPRVGMEVVVDFLEGDPDRPLVTGCVYNGASLPPWALPDNKTRTGWVSRSSAQGAAANANEFWLDDKKGEELVQLWAEKDFKRTVENDEVADVQHDQTSTIKNDRTVTISEGNDALTITKGNRTGTISEGDDTLTIAKGKQTVSIKSDASLTVEGKRTETITGNDSLTVSSGNRSTTLDSGNDTLTASSGNVSIEASAGKISLQAGQKIELTSGGSTITIEPAGITMKGMKLALAGDVTVEIKGAMTTVKGDGTLTLKGGMVMIN